MFKGIKFKNLKMKGGESKMKRIIAVVAVLLLLGYSFASAQILSSSELDSVYAGQFDNTVEDDISGINSAVAAQKNITTFGSTDGAVSASTATNLNTASVTNIGDSAVGIQTNIAAIAGLGTTLSSDDNTISSTNEAEVVNTIANDTGSADDALTGTSASGAGTNSLASTVSALQSAIASQNNIAAIVGGGGVNAGTITNTNTATVTNAAL